MKRIQWVALELMVAGALACAATAQTALYVQPSRCVLRAGDDLRWAAPGVDETGWQPASRWTGDSTIEPHFWLRCQINPAELAPAVKPVLQVEADAAYEIFIDGRLLARFGDVNTGSHTVGVVNQYESPGFSGRAHPLLLAARITFTPTLYGQQPLPWIMLGDSGLMRDQYSAQVLQGLGSRWIVWVCNAIMAGAGIFFLALYLFERTQRVLLWASITWLGLALLRFDEFLIAASVHFPSRMEFLLYSIGNVEEVFYVLFFFALAGRRVPGFFRALMATSVIDTVLLLVAALLPLRQSMAWRYWLDTSPQVDSVLIPVFVLMAFAPLVAFWPVNKLPRSQLALYFVCSFWMGMDVLYLGAQIPWIGVGNYAFLQFQSVRSVAIAGVVVAMTLLLIQRIRRTNRERAALAAEMRAAREIQRILVPPGIESAAGLKVEAVFLPAQEVGGDFYRCRVLPDGSQWLLLGDVSGKGTAAGMTGAMLLGACEGHESEEPAEVLRHLNRALCASGVGGLATCVCARIGLQGALAIANAGHLPPYRNGEELEIEGGLPLGVAIAAEYREKLFQLEPGDMLTFLSDGVVEAQSPAKELFGFERAREISNGSAQEIAQAAQRFGQQDDITVLKLALQPAAALAART